MTYRLIEHTADLGAEVTAPDLGGLMGEAARALTAVAVEEGAIEPRVERTVTVTGLDLPDLLVNWLSELIYLQETEGLVFCDFEPDRAGETALEMTVRGEALDPARHALGREVKAVTFHELVVEPTSEGWRAAFVFDL